MMRIVDVLCIAVVVIVSCAAVVAGIALLIFAVLPEVWANTTRFEWAMYAAGAVIVGAFIRVSRMEPPSL